MLFHFAYPIQSNSNVLLTILINSSREWFQFLMHPHRLKYIYQPKYNRNWIGSHRECPIKVIISIPRMSSAPFLSCWSIFIRIKPSKIHTHSIYLGQFPSLGEGQQQQHVDLWPKISGPFFSSVHRLCCSAVTSAIILLILVFGRSSSSSCPC